MLIWEGILGNLLFGTSSLSIQQQVVAVADRVAGSDFLKGPVSVQWRWPWTGCARSASLARPAEVGLVNALTPAVSGSTLDDGHPADGALHAAP